MPGFKPRDFDYFDDPDNDLDHELDDDLDDGLNDDFGEPEGFDDHYGGDPVNDGRTDEEWEKYLEQMDPDGGRNAGRTTPARKTSRKASSADGKAAEGKGKKKGRGALVALALLLLAAGVGAYIWFFTDLYYVASVKMVQSRVDMFVGESLTLEHELTVFGSGEPDLEWSSSAPDVASVDGLGAVSACAAGDATVTLSEPESGLTAQCTVSVHAVDELVLSDRELTLGVGETHIMSVQTGALSAEQPVFVCSDSDVATVDESGRVTAVSVGTTDVTVSARGFNDASFSITVMAAPTVISSSDAGGMCLGETRQITALPGEGEYCSLYGYQSDDPSVVSVDAGGLMSAVAEGTANITISAYNGVSCTLPVTVGEEAGKVTVPEKLTAYNGVPVNLGAADSTGNCRQFFYTSSAPEIVQVSEQGDLSVLRCGTATITCTSYNGSSAQCEVTAKAVDYTTPYTSARVNENIAVLAASYPELVSVESIGTSVQGRDIPLVKLGTGERKALVVAGMHSRENISVSFTMRCIEEYARYAAAGERYDNYNVKKLLEKFTVYFVPLLNPDGLDIYMGIAQPEYTDQPLTQEEIDEFKNTANGVNLNRNFPFEWGYKGVNVTEPDNRSFAGTSAGSEPETQAIMALCAANEFEWLLDMHCKGHMIYYKDKVNELTEESNKLARRLYQRCDFGFTDQSTLYEISGGLENWFRMEYGKPGICIELVGNKYNPLVNKHFDYKLDWPRTKFVFLMCLED